MKKQNTPKAAPIRVIAGRPISEYPDPDEIKSILRHFYHEHGEAGLTSLLEELSHDVLILILLKAQHIVEHRMIIEEPPASGCKEVAHG